MEKDGGRDNFSWNFKIAKNRQGGRFACQDRHNHERPVCFTQRRQGRGENHSVVILSGAKNPGRGEVWFTSNRNHRWTQITSKFLSPGRKGILGTPNLRNPRSRTGRSGAPYLRDPRRRIHRRFWLCSCPIHGAIFINGQRLNNTSTRDLIII